MSRPRDTDLVTEILSASGEDLVVEFLLQVTDDDDLVADILLDLDVGTDLVTEIGFTSSDVEFVAEALSVEEREFREAFSGVVGQAMKRERQGLEAVRDHFKNYKEQVLGTMTGITEWDAHHLEEVRRSLDAATDRLQSAISGEFNATATEMSGLALQAVDAPLHSLGIMTAHLPSIMPTEQLAVIRSYVPTLIKDVSLKTQKQVQGILTSRMMGGMNAAQARARIGRAVGPLMSQVGRTAIPGKVFTGADRRARTIMRTETNRVWNTVSTARLDQLAEVHPDVVGKVWVHNPQASYQPRSRHAALNRKVIFPGKGEKFRVGHYKAAGPYDPNLPAGEIINCHCRTRIAYPSEVKAELERRGAGAGAVKKKPVVTKKPKAKAKPKKAATIDTALEVSPPPKFKNKTEAKKWADDLVSLDIDKYPKRIDGSWLTHYSGRSQAHIGKVNYSGLTVDAMNEINEALYEVYLESRRRGIPMLRGVAQGIRKKGAIADMGDGIMGIKRGFFNDYAKAAKQFRDMAPADRRSMLIGQASRNREGLKTFRTWATGEIKALEAKGRLTPPRVKYLASLKDDLALLDKSSAYWDDAITRATTWDGVGWPPPRIPRSNYWLGLKNSGPGLGRPFTAEAYLFEELDATLATIWHEYGHHVHQITGYVRHGRDAYIKMTSSYHLENALAKEVMKYTGHYTATTYGGKKRVEWFAENFCLWMSDRRDLVAPRWVEFCKNNNLL